MERTNTHESLYASSLIEASLDPLVTISKEGKIMDLNQATVNITATNRNKLIGSDFFDYFTEQHKARKVYQEIFAKGFVRDSPLTLCNKDGKLTDVLFNGSVYKDNKGDVLGVVIVARDVTERNRIEEEIKKLNETLEQKVNERTIQLKDLNNELTIQNNEKEKRTNELVIANRELDFQNREKEKRSDELIIANKELAFQNNEKENRADELIIANKELAFQNDEKEKRANELIVANKELLFQNNEKEKRAAELIVTEKKLVEEKEKQEAANKELEAFSYSVSHDLRAPLRHIGGFIDLLVKNNSSQLNETGLRYLNTISESSKEMGNLIDALLSFSRLGRTELLLTKSNSINIINRALKYFSDEIAERNIEINISELPNPTCDENLIIQVWVNLISNAFKYSQNKEKATIKIGGKAEINEMIFYIKDNGVGFNMKYADKLFGVFQRLHKARDFEGIGIGLANVNRIILRHGGKCWAESEVDKGATFYFSLPIIK